MSIHFLKKDNIFIISLLVVILTLFYTIYALISATANTSPVVVIWTGDTVPPITWNINTGIVAEEASIHTKIIMSWVDLSSWESFDSNKFPQFIINRMPKNLEMVIDLDFSPDFVEKFPWYANSDWYWFSIKVFFDSINNGGFFNVFRKTDGWVANDVKSWLTWRVIASDIKGWYTRHIPLDEKFIVATDFTEVRPGYQYKYFDPQKYIIKKDNSPIRIWVFFSSVSELQWRKFTYIEDIKITYEWYNSDVVLLKN